MTELKRCIACGESQQLLFRAIIEGREYFYHGSHDCHAPHVDMLATIAKAHAEAKCADYERLRDALDGYDVTRYADTFKRTVDALGAAVLVINGLMDRSPDQVERWRLLAQTCDGDHLSALARKLKAVPPAAPCATTSSEIVAARKSEESSSGGRK